MTKDAAFDIEPNSSLATPQNLGNVQVALGNVQAGTVSQGLYYLWDFNGAKLYTVSTAGVVSALGPAGISAEISGLAYNPAHHILYGSDATGDLFTFNTTTGAATSLGTLSLAISYALAYNPLDGMLYSVNSNGGAGADQSGGHDRRGRQRPGPGTTAGGMVYNPADRQIYCHSNGSPRVYSYDAVTFSGPVTHAAPTVSPNYGMTYNGSTLVLGPGTTSGGTFYSYDPITGSCTALFPAALLAGLGLDDFVFAPASNDVNCYVTHFNAGDMVTIGTQTPGDGPGQFVNLLDPKLELYDPNGTLAAGDDNGAADGRNALLQYTVTVTGNYVVRVLAAAQQGEYVLTIAVGFGVTATTPVNGQLLPPSAPPATFTVTFNSAVLGDSVQNADLVVDGMPDALPAPPSFPNENTVVFVLPALLRGNHQVTIAAGTILDVQNRPLEPFASTFVIDTPPRIVGSSIAEGSIVPPGSLTYTATFDEPMDTSGADGERFFPGGGVGRGTDSEHFFLERSADAPAPVRQPAGR